MDTLSVAFYCLLIILVLHW